MSNNSILNFRLVACCAVAAVALAGCGSSSKRSTPTSSHPTALEEICHESQLELTDISNHTVGDMEPSVAGRVLKEGEEASDKILEATITKVRSLPPSGSQARALRNAEANRDELQGLIRLLSTRRISDEDLPAHAIRDFGRAAGACATFHELQAKG